MTNITHARPVYKKTLTGYRTVDIQMGFNPAKCRTMHLGKHNSNTKYTLPTDDGTLYEIAQTAEEKDLGIGVTMDDKLIFSRHNTSQQS